MNIPYTLVLVVHVIVSLLLIAVILVQGGRGGMTETLGGAAAQSLFGGGANIVMSKVTAAGAILFMITCVTLAMLSTQQGKSVIDRIPISAPAGTNTVPPLPGMPSSDTEPKPTEQTPAQ